MKIFVTGSTGFVGSHLCDKLTELGHEVYALVRSTEKAKSFNVPGKYIIGSLADNGTNGWINDLPEDLDAVIHTAGIVHSNNTSSFYKVNTEATKVLARDLKDKYTHLKFVFVSSLAATGPSDNRLVNEKSECLPVSQYGQSKLDAENKLADMLPKSWGLKIIRPPMVIGPRDPAVLDVFKMVQSGNVLMAGKDGEKKSYSFICVYDLVDTIIRATTNKKDKFSEVYFSSYPISITMGELINEIKSQLNIEKVRYVKAPYFVITIVAYILSALSRYIKLDARLTPDKTHEIFPESWVCSGKKAESQLGQIYEWPLDKTIKETLKDYKERNWI